MTVTVLELRASPYTAIAREHGLEMPSIAAKPNIVSTSFRMDLCAPVRLVVVVIVEVDEWILLGV